jgi:hypothetical protein
MDILISCRVFSAACKCILSVFLTRGWLIFKDTGLIILST